MTTHDVHAPTLAVQGEPCATCGAPLAADQRYCLNCGARRTEARLAFREILAPPAVAAGVAAAAPVAAPRPAGIGPADRGAIAALGALGCLLLALGIGVLIGRSGKDTAPAPAQPPQVVLSGATTGAAGAVAAPTDTTATTPATPAGGSSKSSKKKSSSSGSGSSQSKATNTKLKSLEKLSPKDYQKQSQKLPKVVGTGGTAPPKDNKAPAGGGSFETIG